jgi:Flp pilus assembly pilin Flp
MDVRRPLRREDGQTMAEYSVILAVLVTGVIAALSFLGVAIAGRFLTFLGFLTG